jgi:NADPH:quinone reductase-like Zn-dependent oxidoreductase
MRTVEYTRRGEALQVDDWQGQVRRHAGERGVHVVLDCVGGAMTQDLAELLADGGTLISYGHLSSGTTPSEALPLSRTPRDRAEDVASAQDLAQSTPDLLDVAAGYDVADFKPANEHARRPAKSGTVLLTTPRTADSGNEAA